MFMLFFFPDLWVTDPGAFWQRGVEERSTHYTQSQNLIQKKTLKVTSGKRNSRTGTLPIPPKTFDGGKNHRYQIQMDQGGRKKKKIEKMPSSRYRYEDLISKCKCTFRFLVLRD